MLTSVTRTTPSMPRKRRSRTPMCLWRSRKWMTFLSTGEWHYLATSKKGHKSLISTCIKPKTLIMREKPKSSKKWPRRSRSNERCKRLTWRSARNRTNRPTTEGWKQSRSQTKTRTWETRAKTQTSKAAWWTSYRKMTSSSMTPWNIPTGLDEYVPNK